MFPMRTWRGSQTDSSYSEKWQQQTNVCVSHLPGVRVVAIVVDRATRARAFATSTSFDCEVRRC
eukprot:6204547-Pleurochrysis_carterae.AAC.3